MPSVLQDWVMTLPLREQGTLLTGVRGCDDTPKLPLDSTARSLVCYLRWTFMNPADPREVDIEPGAFFSSKPPTKWKASELGHLPQHYYSHLMHCFEVVGHRHPNPATANICREIYWKLVHSLHLIPETKYEMIQRLSEDRIATGEVVS